MREMVSSGNSSPSSSNPAENFVLYNQAFRNEGDDVNDDDDDDEHNDEHNDEKNDNGDDDDN